MNESNLKPLILQFIFLLLFPILTKGFISPVLFDKIELIKIASFEDANNFFDNFKIHPFLLNFNSPELWDTLYSIQLDNLMYNRLLGLINVIKINVKIRPI